MAEYVFGGKNVLFWVIQLATFGILVLAANTAYAGFPALSSIIARDGYLPRQMANRGDKLVFSNGIIFLAAAAGVLIIAFEGNVTALIPLYAFGVFTGFTLSQAGMVVHHFRLREPRWKLGAAINGLGATLTGVVAIVVVVSKFSKGAWIPAVLIPVMVVMFKAISSHYRAVRSAVQVQPGYRPDRHTHTVVILVGTVHKGVLDAIQYARELAPDRLFAVSVVQGPDEQEELARAWEQFDIPIPVHTILSPYRDLTGPVLELPRRDRRRQPRRRDHGHHPRVRHAVEDPVAAQPVGVRPQGPPAVPPEHSRHVRPGSRRHRPRRVTWSGNATRRLRAVRTSPPAGPDRRAGSRRRVR